MAEYTLEQVNDILRNVVSDIAADDHWEAYFNNNRPLKEWMRQYCPEFLDEPYLITRERPTHTKFKYAIYEQKIDQYVGMTLDQALADGIALDLFLPAGSSIYLTRQTGPYSYMSDASEEEVDRLWRAVCTGPVLVTDGSMIIEAGDQFSAVRKANAPRGDHSESAASSD